MSHCFFCIPSSRLFLWKYLIWHALMSELLLERQNEEERAKKLRSTARKRKSHQLLCKLYYCHHCGGFGACDWLETERTEAHWGAEERVNVSQWGCSARELLPLSSAGRRSAAGAVRGDREKPRGECKESWCCCSALLLLLLLSLYSSKRTHTSPWKHSITF